YGDPAHRQAVAGPGRRAQVLHGAADVVRHAVVGVDVIELRDGRGRGVPALAGVGRDVHAAVVAVDHPPRVGRVDPQVVVGAVVRAVHGAEGAAAVDALEQRDVRGPDDVSVLRIHGERGVVPGPLPQVVVCRGQPPALAAVVGAVEAALFGLDQ